MADGMAEVPEALEDVVPTTDVEAEERRRTGERRQEEAPVEADRREGEWRAPREKQAGGPAASRPPTPAPRSASTRSPIRRYGQGPILASPAVRARARDLGIDLSQVKFAGDRVRHADLDAYLLYNGGSVSRGPAPQAAGRGRQGGRPAPQDRREHAGGEAPHPAFHLGRGI